MPTKGRERETRVWRGGFALLPYHGCPGSAPLPSLGARLGSFRGRLVKGALPGKGRGGWSVARLPTSPRRRCLKSLPCPGHRRCLAASARSPEEDAQGEGPELTSGGVRKPCQLPVAREFALLISPGGRGRAKGVFPGRTERRGSILGRHGGAQVGPGGGCGHLAMPVAVHPGEPSGAWKGVRRGDAGGSACLFLVLQSIFRRFPSFPPPPPTRFAKVRAFTNERKREFLF